MSVCGNALRLAELATFQKKGEAQNIHLGTEPCV